MPIHFICPHCAAATDVDEKFAGETGPCAHCGKAITIPTMGGMLPEPPRSNSAVPGVIAAAILGVAALVAAVVWVLWPTNSSDRDLACRLECVHNLRQIAEAMKQYEAVFGCFPPAYLVDRQGLPAHSWRTLLLPYLGQQDLYDRYRFNERWDSAHNRAVTDLSIGLFQCPGQPNTDRPTTNYMMVVGPHTISKGRESTKLTDITDGPVDTIMLVEVADSTTRWAEPEDLRLDKIDCAINGKTRPGISSHHPVKRPQGVNTAFCDGSVRWLKNSTNPELVKAMLTIDVGEPIPANMH